MLHLYQVVFTDEYETPLILKAISYELRKTVTFGDVRASNLALSSRFGIRKYPSLVVVCDAKGSAIVKYDGEFKAKSIVSFMDGLKSGEACNVARSELISRKKNLDINSMDFNKVKYLLRLTFR